MLKTNVHNREFSEENKQACEKLSDSGNMQRGFHTDA